MGSRTSSNAAGSPALPRRCRWAKRLGFVAVALVLVGLITGGLLLTPAAGIVIRPRLEHELGVQAIGGSLRLNLDGDVIIRDVTFRTLPGPDKPRGEAARFLTIDRGQILLWWRARLRGQPLVRRVEVFESSMRLTKPLDDFDLNILAIDLPESNRTGGTLPSIIVHQASVLLGEHNGNGEIEELRTLPMVFSLRPSRTRPDSYDVTAVEDKALTTSVKPIRFEGSIGPDGFSGRLGGIDMADFPPSRIPRQLRDVYTELNVGGRTRGATVQYDQALEVLELVLDFQDAPPTPAPFADDSAVAGRLNLRLPVPTDEQGTLQPLIPASGSGLIRLVQRPSPRTDQIVPWTSVQAASEPGEPGPGKRTLTIEGRLHSTIEDARVSIDVNMWLGGAEPLYEFEVATLEPYTMTPDAAWLTRPAPVIQKISKIVELLQPAGTVSMVASASQVADGDGVKQIVNGSGALQGGALQFKYFPYPVENVKGTITLDNGRIELVGLNGQTPSGAPVLASTLIRLDEVATGVNVDVWAFGVPYDDTLRQTLDDIAPEIREIVLNEAALERLRQEGVVRAPGRPGRAPSFELGGQADAHVRVTRRPGFDGSTTVRVEVQSSNFGLLPEAFPVPIIANDVRLTVDVPPELETTARGLQRKVIVAARGAKATTLSGGAADASVVVEVPIDEPEGVELSTTVDVDVDARSVPVHPALLAALPGGDQDGMLAGGPRRVLRDFRPAGEIDATVRVVRDEAGEIDWWAEVSPQQARLSPPPLDRRTPLTIEDLTGLVRVDGDGLQGEVSGRAMRGGQVRAQLRADFEQDRFIGIFTAGDLNLETPVEDAVAVVSPDVAQALKETRQRFDVRGQADVAASVRFADAEVATEVRIARVDRLRFDWLDGRMGLDNGLGSIIVQTTENGLLASFDRMLAEGLFDGERIGRVRLRGEIPVAALTEEGSQFDRPTTLGIEVQGGSLGSTLLRSLAANRGSDQSESFLQKWDLQGEYDALVSLETAAYQGEGPGVRPLRTFELSPYNATIVRDGQLVEVPWVSGLIVGRESTPSAEGPGGASTYSGEIDNLTIGGEDWWLGMDGYWRSEAGQSSQFEVDLDGVIQAGESSPRRRHGVPTTLLGFMPPGVIRALESMEVQSTGALLVEDGWLRVSNQRSEPTRYQVEADLAVDSVLLGTRPGEREAQQGTEGAGRPIAELRDAWLSVSGDTAHPTERSRIEARAADGRVWNLQTGEIMLEAVARTDGLVELSDLQASVSGGRLAGRGRIVLPAQESERARFELDLAGAGLQTERVVAAMQDRQPEQARGLGDLDLSLGLEGRMGNVDSLSGRGSMRIRGGSPVELPVAIRAAVEALNVNFGADRYDAVSGEFYVQGPLLTFTRLAVSSESVVLEGLGTVSLGDGALDITVAMRPINDTPLRALTRAVRDVIVGVELRGTLDNPVPAPQPQALVGPFDRLRRMIQGGLNHEEWEKERLRNYARQRGDPKSGW